MVEMLHDGGCASEVTRAADMTDGIVYVQLDCLLRHLLWHRQQLQVLQVCQVSASLSMYLRLIENTHLQREHMSVTEASSC